MRGFQNMVQPIFAACKHAPCSVAIEMATVHLLILLRRRLRKRPTQFWGFDTLDPDWLVRLHAELHSRSDAVPH